MALKACFTTDANWDAIWTVVHEELCNKRHGRTSHLPIPQATGVTAPATTGAPLGKVVKAPGGQAVVGAPKGGAQCYSSGQLGHWARQCLQAAVQGTLLQSHVQAKISQVGDQAILAINKGWMFHLNGPPPAGNADNPIGKCSHVGLKDPYHWLPRLKPMPRSAQPAPLFQP